MVVSRRGYTQIRSILLKELDDFLKTYRRMPSQRELMLRIRKINADMYNELVSAMRPQYGAVYQKVAQATANQLGISTTLSAVDIGAIERLATNPITLQSFSNLSQQVSVKFQKIFEDAYSSPKGFSRKKIQEQIKQVADVTDFRAETIARTESAKISAGARYNQYRKVDPMGQRLYIWVGVNDNRTTDTSKRIKARVGNGVVWEELIRIITQESAKDFPKWRVDPTALLSHYSSRHTFLLK